VLGILEGLSDVDLRRPVLPSAWTCVGLLRHLALDVERFWFGVIMAGESEEVPGSPDTAGEAAWRVPESVAPQEVIARYRLEVERSNQVIARTSLEAGPAWWPEDRWSSWRFQNLRQVMLHVIAETACHAGHADAARELIDGRRWMVLE